MLPELCTEYICLENTLSQVLVSERHAERIVLGQEIGTVSQLCKTRQNPIAPAGEGCLGERTIIAIGRGRSTDSGLVSSSYAAYPGNISDDCPGRHLL